MPGPLPKLPRNEERAKIRAFDKPPPTMILDTITEFLLSLGESVLRKLLEILAIKAATKLWKLTRRKRLEETADAGEDAKCKPTVPSPSE